MPETPHRLPVLKLSLAVGLALSLAACGGGGGDSSSDSSGPDAATAQSTSADASTLTEDAAATADLAVNAALAVDTSQLSAASARSGTLSAKPTDLTGSHACAGGGSVQLTLSGASNVLLLNGQLDTGEVYAMNFSQCSGSAGAAALTGSATLTVNQASASSLALTLSTGTDGLVAALPAGTLTLTGSETIARSQSGDPAGTWQTSSSWQAASLALRSQRNGRDVSYTLANAQGQRDATWLAGTLSTSSSTSVADLSATGLLHAFSLHLATQGAVSYDASGNPVSGTLTVDLSDRNRLEVSVGGGSVTVGVDLGADGSVDRSHTWTRGEWLASAGS
ncbi:hypothetical protein LRH25_26110 [Ideonella azotifigens]|uniref:Uncharacterized protein n=2 Tax=Ideonella azotifigens TaxID=513160 RepID=A0ABN1K289_9BURK|nr:hypothetical protein [Ideonella azotifigens]MCD2343802.1 hypothetical protein [Ideonella azotifigens]